MANPDITVAIPTYKRERILLDSIQDILQQSHNNFELMVIDQSPEHPADFKQAIAAIKDKRFRYILADPLPCRLLGILRCTMPLHRLFCS